MTETIKDQGTPVQEEAKRRFRVANFIQRTGSRAQKRAIQAGKASKRISGNAAKGLWGQIAEPYTVLKQIGVGLGLIGGGVLMWYITIVAMLSIIGGTGSIVLGIVGAIALYMVVARFIYLPLSLAAAGYFARSADYHIGGQMRNAGTIRTSGAPSFA